MKRTISMAILLAACTGVVTFVGCDGGGGGGSGGSSPLSSITGDKGLTNFFVKPVQDSVVATGQAFQGFAAGLYSKIENLFTPSEIGITPSPTGSNQELQVDFSASDFTNNNCHNIIGAYPLGKEAGYLPTWYTNNVTKNKDGVYVYSNTGEYELGVMGEFAFVFLLDVHCHGYEFFDYNQDYTTVEQTDTLTLDGSNSRITYTGLYATYKDNKVGLAWKKEGDYYVGAMRFDTYLCSQLEDGHLAGLLPNDRCGEPATTGQTVSGEESFLITAKHSIYKKEKETSEGVDRLVQITSRYIQKVNYGGFYCKHVLDTVQEAKELNGDITINAYAKLSVQDVDVSNDNTHLNYYCGVETSRYSGDNSLTVSQYLDVAQTSDNTRVYYQCDNTGDYGILEWNTSTSSYDATDDEIWKYYPAWCYYKSNIDNKYAPRGNNYVYSTGIIMAEFDTSGNQVGSDTITNSYSFKNQSTLQTALEAIEDSDFTPDGVNTNALW